MVINIYDINHKKIISTNYSGPWEYDGEWFIPKEPIIIDIPYDFVAFYVGYVLDVYDDGKKKDPFEVIVSLSYKKPFFSGETVRIESIPIALTIEKTFSNESFGYSVKDKEN